MILVAVSTLILYVSLTSYTIYIYHFIPIFGLFIILIAEVISSAFQNSLLSNAMMLIVVLLFIKVVSNNFALFKFLPSKLPVKVFESINIDDSDKDPVLSPIVNIMENKIREIQTRRHFKNFVFFQIRYYRYNQALSRPYPVVDAVFWTPIESHLKTKFTATTKNYGYYTYKFFSYVPVSRDEYLFVICGMQKKLRSGCLNFFLHEHTNHRITQKIYEKENFSVYLAEKI